MQRRPQSSRARKPPPSKDVPEPTVLQRHPLADLSEEEAEKVAADEMPKVTPEELAATRVKELHGRTRPWQVEVDDRSLPFASRSGAALARVRYQRELAVAREIDDRATGRGLSEEAAREAAEQESPRVPPEELAAAHVRGPYDGTRPWQASVDGGQQSFASRSGAALAWVRYRRELAAARERDDRATGRGLSEEAAREAAEQESPRVPPEELAAAHVRGPYDGTRPWQASVDGGQQSFASRSGAALAWVRYRRELAAARERDDPPAAEALECAAAEGLVLQKKRRADVECYEGVYRANADKYGAFVLPPNVERREYLGQFSCPEAAALCIARHLATLTHVCGFVATCHCRFASAEELLDHRRHFHLCQSTGVRLVDAGKEPGAADGAGSSSQLGLMPKADFLAAMGLPGL